MEHFTLDDHAEVMFMSGSPDPFTIYVGSKVNIASQSHLDVSKLWEVNINATYRFSEIAFGQITYGRILIFNYG